MLPAVIALVVALRDVGTDVSLLSDNTTTHTVNHRHVCSFSALTLLVGSFSRKNPSPILPIMCLLGR